MRRTTRWAAVLGCGVAACVQARDCTLDGEPVNLDNGSSTAGRSGLVTCRDDAGQVVSERTLRDGRFVGLERTRDLWGHVRERNVNANGNTQGVAREFWPDGTLKSEAGYEDGTRAGAGRSYHESGGLAALSFEQAEPRLSARLEYDEQGRLTGLQCEARSLFPEDRGPCGFDGERTSELVRRGLPSARVTYMQGTLRVHESLGAAGEVVERLQRDGQDERRERFHPGGERAGEVVVRGGFVVEEREWYMNGQRRSEVLREAKVREARSETRRWRDDGTAEEAEVRVGTRRVATTRYDERGRIELIEDWHPDGYVARRRRFVAGEPVADETLHPDGSRRSAPLQVGGGGA